MNKTVEVKRKKKVTTDRKEYTLQKNSLVSKKMRIATKIGSVNMALTPEKNVTRNIGKVLRRGKKCSLCKHQ